MTEQTQPPERAAFQQAVLDWYQRHGRKDLPWQLERSPYRVWISEIMLQQTQVAAVIPYFERFVSTFPDIETLASAELDEVLLAWAGLGYYARARHLHHAAQIVERRFEGELPTDRDALMSLPGIGRSTAGAIISLGHRQTAAILDGNVKRVLCRYWKIEGWPGSPAVSRALWSLSERLTPGDDAGSYNQAMMDLGAMVCTPRNPACGQCPITNGCRARIAGNVLELPERKPQRTVPVRRAMALVLCDPSRNVYLERRPPIGIWGGLWCLPMIEQHTELDDWAANRGMRPSSIEPLPPRRHTFSHFHLDYVPLRIQIDRSQERISEPAQAIWQPPGNGCKLGLPTPIRALLAELGYFDTPE